MCRTVILALFVLAGGAAGAQEPAIGSAREGLEYSRTVCAYCHYVEPDGPLLDELAPRAFTAIAADPKTTETALRVFLRTTHIQMPDFILTEEQTDNVVAYILSLKPGSSAE